MDLDIVARTLSDRLTKHSQEPVDHADVFEHGRGYKFLEKIIQTRISIPAYGPEQIQAFIEQLVPASSRGKGAPATADPPPPPVEEPVDDSPELRSAILKYAPAHFTNPRRIKRFVNALRLHVYLAQASGFHADVDELARFLMLTERWPRLMEAFVRHASREHTASDTDLPTDPQASERSAWWDRWRCMEFQNVQAPQDALTLLDGIDAGRLQVLCDWYGFRYYGDSEATKLVELGPPVAQVDR
jgi:KAP family P-loop domain